MGNVTFFIIPRSKHTCIIFIHLIMNKFTKQFLILIEKETNLLCLMKIYSLYWELRSAVRMSGWLIQQYPSLSPVCFFVNLKPRLTCALSAFPKILQQLSNGKHWPPRHLGLVRCLSPFLCHSLIFQKRLYIPC